MCLRICEIERSGLTTKDVLFLQDNTRYDAAHRTTFTIQLTGCEVLLHPAYSPDLATTDFQVLSILKQFLGGQHFHYLVFGLQLYKLKSPDLSITRLVCTSVCLFCCLHLCQYVSLV